MTTILKVKSRTVEVFIIDVHCWDTLGLTKALCITLSSFTVLYPSFKLGKRTNVRCSFFLLIAYCFCLAVKPNYHKSGTICLSQLENIHLLIWSVLFPTRLWCQEKTVFWFQDRYSIKSKCNANGTSLKATEGSSQGLKEKFKNIWLF